MAILWSDIADDDDSVLPPRQVIGPDEKGIKKVIDYKFDDENNTVAITTTIRVRKLSQQAAERRSWPKFVDAVPAVPADDNSRLTMVSTEEIFLERPKRAPGTKPEETTATGDSLAQLGKGGGALMVCRTCFKKGDHWTAMCPYKNLAAAPEGSIDNPTTSDSAVASGSGKSAYIPPSMRAGAERTGTDMRRRNDDNSVRVNNLSEDTREADLRELFEPFGAVTRAYVAIDQKTGTSRGFGFVSFVNKEDAQRAINKLNGYGYDNLILRVEWAAPRAN